MVAIRAGSKLMFDISFMYTKECDLECPFCMYDSSPRVKDRLDLLVARSFIDSIDFNLVNSFGLYGGEPSVALDGYSAICEMLPPHIPMFTITNGAWSLDRAKTDEFIRWAKKYDLTVFVSSTPFHQKHQSTLGISHAQASWDKVKIKRPEQPKDFLPMGKLDVLDRDCSRVCLTYERPTRIALQPDGSVIFQNCDGRYPVIGHAREGFQVISKRTEDVECTYKVKL